MNLKGVNLACAAVLTVLGTVCMRAAAQCRYEVTIIQAPECKFTGHPGTTGTNISPNGRYVVGRYAQCDPLFDEAFVYDMLTAEFFTIPRPPGVVSAWGNGVNDLGMVVGGSYVGTASLNVLRGFVYELSTGEWTELPPQNGHPQGESEALNVNASGQVCGYRSIGTKTNPVNPKTAFVWSSKDGFRDLGLLNRHGTIGEDVNDAGVATGVMGIGNNTHPFVWDDASVVELGTLAGLETRPTALNNTGIVIGWSKLQVTPPVIRAVAWNSEIIVDLGVLPGFLWSTALDVNDAGTVIGRCSNPGSSQVEPFIWQNGVMLPLNDFIPPELGLTKVTPGAITNQGLITGQAQLPGVGGKVAAFVLAPESSNIGDIDHDCRTDINDLFFVISDWGKNESPADVNADAVVNVQDLMIVVENWTLE